MKLMALFVTAIVCQSCFLFSDFRKTRISLDGHTVNTVVPKKFGTTQTETDSLGNVVRYYHYPGGAVMYFASLKDTSTQLQPIDYTENIPKELYHTVFYKGLDSTRQFWRETRFGTYRAGYRNVDADDESTFDSSINYFSLHMRH